VHHGALRSPRYTGFEVSWSGLRQKRYALENPRSRVTDLVAYSRRKASTTSTLPARRAGR
jgi:hypothetical protein